MNEYRYEDEMDVDGSELKCAEEQDRDKAAEPIEGYEDMDETSNENGDVVSESADLEGYIGTYVDNTFQNRNDTGGWHIKKVKTEENNESDMYSPYETVPEENTSKEIGIEEDSYIPYESVPEGNTNVAKEIRHNKLAKSSREPMGKYIGENEPKGDIESVGGISSSNENGKNPVSEEEEKLRDALILSWEEHRKKEEKEKASMHQPEKGAFLPIEWSSLSSQPERRGKSILTGSTLAKYMQKMRKLRQQNEKYSDELSFAAQALMPIIATVLHLSIQILYELQKQEQWLKDATSAQKELLYVPLERYIAKLWHLEQ